MKSIKQQYIDLREGNMSQANFMRNLRMSLPQYVTNLSSFEDSVRILKNKGILTEADIKENDGSSAAQRYAEKALDSGLTIDNSEQELATKLYDLMVLDMGEERAKHTMKHDKDFKQEFLQDLRTLSNELKSGEEEEIMEGSMQEEELWRAAFDTEIETMDLPPVAAQIIDDSLDHVNPYTNYKDMNPGEAAHEFVQTVLAAKEYTSAKEDNDYNEDDEKEAERINMMIDQELENRFDENKSLRETISDDDIMKKYNEMFGKNPQTKFADVAKALNIPEDQVASALQSGAMPKFGLKEAKDEKGKWTNTSGKSMYDQFKEIDNLNGQEVLIGIDYEMEKNHELTKTAAAKIVLKNLKKNPIYYTATLMAGKEGYEIGYIGGKSANAEARQMQPLEKNLGNIVDKVMGMKPVKDVEKVKKDSDKGGETNKAVKNISLMSLVAKSVRGLKKMDATGEKMKTIKLSEGEYTTNWDFNKDEQAKLKKLLNNDVEFDREEEEQTVKTTLTSKTYNEKSLAHAVDQVTNSKSFSSKIKPGVGDAIQKSMKESAEDKLAEQVSQYIKEITGVYGGDAMDAEDGSSYINEVKLFADFSDSIIPKTSLDVRFARSISEVAREYDYMDNIDIPGYFDVYEDGDDVYAGPVESLEFFKALPNEFTVTNNMNDVEESFKITKTGSDSFTAKEI